MGRRANKGHRVPRDRQGPKDHRAKPGLPVSRDNQGSKGHKAIPGRLELLVQKDHKVMKGHKVNRDRRAIVDHPAAECVGWTRLAPRFPS